MKNRQDYMNEAPAMEIRIKKVNPARAYAISVQSELSDFRKRIQELESRKKVAAFLMYHSPDEIHQMVDSVNSDMQTFN